MPDIIADPADPPCYYLFSRPGIAESQLLDPDLFARRARGARGRFAKGTSGNPRGRPRGIPNPRRLVPDLAARKLSPQALADLLDRRPHLLRPLAAQLLPPPAAIDPAERLGIDLSSLRTSVDFQQALRRAWTAISGGLITPAEGARLARRVRARRRALRRFARLERRLGRSPARM